jgi:hypothetical protein
MSDLHDGLWPEDVDDVMETDYALVRFGLRMRTHGD